MGGGEGFVLAQGSREGFLEEKRHLNQGTIHNNHGSIALSQVLPHVTHFSQSFELGVIIVLIDTCEKTKL